MDSCIVFYSKHDLSSELDDILRIYKIIPEVRNRKSNHIRIDFEFNGKTIYLVVIQMSLKYAIIKELYHYAKFMRLSLKINHLISL